MRKLLLAVLACAAMPAHATLIQIDYSAPSWWSPASEKPFEPGPMFDISIIADTSALKSLQYGFGESSAGVTCLSSFQASFGVISSSVKLDGQEILSGSGTASTGGDGGPPCGALYSGLWFDLGGSPLSFSFDMYPAYTLDQFNASPDPLFDLLQSHKYSAYASFQGLIADVGTLTIVQVPEPGTLGLLGLGLILTTSFARSSARGRSKR